MINVFSFQWIFIVEFFTAPWLSWKCSLIYKKKKKINVVIHKVKQTLSKIHFQCFVSRIFRFINLTYVLIDYDTLYEYFSLFLLSSGVSCVTSNSVIFLDQCQYKSIQPLLWISLGFQHFRQNEWWDKTNIIFEYVWSWLRHPILKCMCVCN